MELDAALDELRQAVDALSNSTLAPNLRSCTSASVASGFRLQVFRDERTTVAAQSTCGAQPDLAHEQLVDDYDYRAIHGSEATGVLFYLDADGTTTGKRPPSSSPQRVASVALKRSSEAVCLGEILLLGDRGSGKTTLAAALTSGDMRVQQLLRYHTSSFLNLWINPTAAELRSFVRELQSEAAAAAAVPAVQRQLPFFPSQLCVGTVVTEAAEVEFFLNDDELAALNADEGSDATTPAAQRLTDVAPTATFNLRVVEVGGDLLEDMMHRAVEVRMLAPILQESLRSATSVAYFVHAQTSLSCPSGKEALMRKLKFVVASCAKPLKVSIFVTHISESQETETSDLLDALRLDLASTFRIDERVHFSVEVAHFVAREGAEKRLAIRFDRVMAVVQRMLRQSFTLDRGGVGERANDRVVKLAAHRILRLARRSGQSIVTMPILAELLFGEGCGGHSHANADHDCHDQPGFDEESATLRVRPLSELVDSLDVLSPLAVFDLFPNAAKLLVERLGARGARYATSSIDDRAVIGLVLPDDTFDVNDLLSVL